MMHSVVTIDWDTCICPSSWCLRVAGLYDRSGLEQVVKRQKVETTAHLRVRSGNWQRVPLSFSICQHFYLTELAISRFKARGHGPNFSVSRMLCGSLRTQTPHPLLNLTDGEILSLEPAVVDVRF